MLGWVTASTALTATAASAAVPPALSASTPARVASGGAAATMPSRPSATWRCEEPTSGIVLGPLEEFGDLVPRELGQRVAAAAGDQGHALGARHHLADEVAVDPLAGEGVDDERRVAR